MSSRVLIASGILAALLAGVALFLLAQGGAPAGGLPDGAVGPGSLGADGTATTDGAEAGAGDDSGGRAGAGAGSSRIAPGDGIGGPPAPGAAGDGASAPGDPHDPTRAGTAGSGVPSGGAGRFPSGSGRSADGAIGPDLPTITVRGTIVAVDAEGERHAGESGRISTRIDAPGFQEIRDIAVVDGAWSAVMPEHARVRFESAVLAERPASVSPGESIAADGIRLDLRAEWTASTLLHVRSRATGEALRDLELLRIPDWLRNSRPHPGIATATDIRRTADASPFVLEPEASGFAGSVPYHVRSPGYAWGRVLVDTSAGGDREVLLDAGGALDLVLTGGWDTPGATLRLRSPGVAQPYAEAALPGAEVRIEGILPGSYDVSVETGNWAQQPHSLGRAEIEVHAGEVVALTLDLEVVGESDRVPFGGTVYVPAAWQLDEFQLRLRPVDPGTNVGDETQHIPSLEMQASPVPGGTLYIWEADAVLPGTHGVLVLPVGYGVNIAVGPEGNLGAEIALPEPVLVEVVTVLAGSAGLPAAPSLIRWTPARAAGVPGAGALSVPPVEGTTNVFRFAAPIGDVIISASDEAYRPASRQVTATLGGPNAFTLELEPAHGVHVFLFDGDTPVPWDIGWYAHLEAEEGTTGQVVTRGRIGMEYRVLVSAPGWYTLTVPSIEGFLPVAPQTVEVLEGQVIDIAVALEREP